MSIREPGVKYSDTQANDPLAELVERANQFWRERKDRRVTGANITSACNAISAILQSFPN